MSEQKQDYVDVVYDEKLRPLNQYPAQMTKHLFDKFKMNNNDSLLELGSGRGDFLHGFVSQGIDGFGIDLSDNYKKHFPHLKVKIGNLEEALPYQDSSFDFVYSKSVIEHFYYPEKLFSEAYRVLKPGGRMISITPSWIHMFKAFYEDHTHRTPFTMESLRDIHLMSGFQDVQVEYFIQLPSVWKRPWLENLCSLTRRVVPDEFKYTNKFIRWSKDVLILGTGIKK